MPTPDLNINISDLTSLSQLKSLLQGSAQSAFQFGAGIAPYWDAPIQTVPNGTAATITVSQDANWKTTAGIGFALSGSALCKLEVITSGDVLTYAPDLDSNSKASSGLPGTDYKGFVYLKISLDFKISGSASGSGNVSGIGISGNAKASADSSVIFCHRVPETAVLSAAIKEAFEKFVFPLEPKCAIDMAEGDIAQVSFNGTLSAGVSISYGIMSIDFAAPGLQSVLDSWNVAKFTLPSGKVDIGATASVSYTHSDDFTAIVQKTTVSNAFLYVMRARKDSASEALGLNAKVTITGTTGVTPNAQTIQHAVDSITGGIGGDQVAAKAQDLAQTLNKKLDDWINNTVQKGATLAFEWDQQKAMSMLFKYTVDLVHASLVTSSWTALCNGDLRAAMTAGGIVLESGSGISHQLSHSFGINLQFFNLFAFSQKDTYFQNSTVELTDSGNIRFMHDIGSEQDVTINKQLRSCRIHFLASINQQTTGALTGASVDLHLELSASNNPKEAGRIGDVVGFIPPNQQANLAQKAMQQFVAGNKPGTLNLNCILKPSAYGRLSCSEFTGNKHDQPPVNQQQDSENWQAFHDASVLLLGLDFVQDISYATWEGFNIACNYQDPDPNNLPAANRRNPGNVNLVPFGFWENITSAPAIANAFARSTAEFMNLCDDLHSLAGLAGAVNDMTQWNALVGSLVYLIKNDTNQDSSKPAIAALLKLSNPDSVTYQGENGNNSFTCTVTLT